MSHRITVVLLALILPTFLGCQKSGVAVSPVNGTVTFQEKPIEGAFVSFVSKDGLVRNASGITDASGKFELQSSGATSAGAMSGEYVVLISKSISVDKQGREIIHDDTSLSPVPTDNASTGMSSMPIQKSLLPEKYNVPTKPILEAIVVKGKNHFTFNLDEK